MHYKKNRIQIGCIPEIQMERWFTIDNMTRVNPIVIYSRKTIKIVSMHVKRAFKLSNIQNSKKFLI